MTRALALVLVVAAGCKSGPSNGYAIDVTVRADQLSSAARASIRALFIRVSGAESWERRYAIDTQFTTDGEARWIYRPASATTGTLELEFLALDDNDKGVGFKNASVTLERGKTKTVRVDLSTMVPEIDGGLGADLSPVPRANGEPCMAGVDRCESGFCVDGFCCDKACDMPCLSCSLPGKTGACTPVPVGERPTHDACPFRSPNDPVAKCSYDGKCDGAGACRLYPKDTPCSSSSCTGNSFTPPSLCDGNGACVQPASFDCTPFKCKDLTACFEPPCTNNTQCYDQGPVFTCDSVTGSCGPLADGRKCTKNEQCVSAHCVDGYCCESACDGQCEACDFASLLGKCLAVPTGGAPHLTNPARTACAGSGICGGSCDGTNRTACRYPTSSVPCANRSCMNNTYISTPMCDGNGTCITPAPLPCPSAPQAMGVCKDAFDCKLACAAPNENCDGQLANGCESNLDSDHQNCGSCGHDCTAMGQVCMGSSVCACPGGTYQCQSSCISTGLCCAPTNAPCSCSATSINNCPAPNNRVAFNCSSQTFTFVSSVFANCTYFGSANKYCCP